MRISKAQKFEKEQYMIQQELIALLGLEESGEGFYLYEMDRDQEKLDQIMKMVPEIWRYFAHMNVTGLLYPEKCKRPWLSIVRGVLKNEWKLRYKPCRYNSTTDGSVFTMRYFLERREEGEAVSSSGSEPPSRAATPDVLAMTESGRVGESGGTMSTVSSCESLCSLEGDSVGGVGSVGVGRRKLKVKRRKRPKTSTYQVEINEIGDSDLAKNCQENVPGFLQRRDSRPGLVC